MSAAQAKLTPHKVVMDALWQNNPIFRQVLGICSTLAVTNLVLNTIVMCAGLVWATALSGWTVSLLRNHTPRRVRMIAQCLIISFYVILVDVALKAYWPAMSAALGPYVGLIITNCIIMGRCEAFSSNNPPAASFLDGLFSGVGYSFVLLAIAVIRELLGMGAILGVKMPFFSGPHFDPWIIMVMPPGAFFMLGLFIWLFRSIGPAQQEKK